MCVHALSTQADLQAGWPRSSTPSQAGGRTVAGSIQTEAADLITLYMEKTYEYDLARPALWRANVVEESGFHGRGRDYARAWHRRQCGDLQCGQCDAASSAAVRRPGQADNDTRNEAAAIS